MVKCIKSLCYSLRKLFYVVLIVGAIQHGYSNSLCEANKFGILLRNYFIMLVLIIVRCCGSNLRCKMVELLCCTDRISVLFLQHVRWSSLKYKRKYPHQFHWNFLLITTCVRYSLIVSLVRCICTWNRNINFLNYCS